MQIMPCDEGYWQKHFHGIFLRGSCISKIPWKCFQRPPIWGNLCIFWCLYIHTHYKTLPIRHILHQSIINTPHIRHFLKQYHHLEHQIMYTLGWFVIMDYVAVAKRVRNALISLARVLEPYTRRIDSNELIRMCASTCPSTTGNLLFLSFMFQCVCHQQTNPYRKLV